MAVNLRIATDIQQLCPTDTWKYSGDCQTSLKLLKESKNEFECN